MRKKSSAGWIALAAFVCAVMICLFAACAAEAPSAETPAELPAETQAESAASDAPTESGQVRPPHFYYQGNTYLYHGHLIYALPEGYEFVAEVNNVGNVSDAPNDFDGNVDGYIYMEPGNNVDTYFQFKTWDEEVDGESPYLYLGKE